LIGGVVESLAKYFLLGNNQNSTNEMDEEENDEDESDEDEDEEPETSGTVTVISNKIEISEKDIDFIMSNTDFTRENVLRWFGTFKAQCPELKLDKSRFIDFYRNLIPGNSDVKDEFAEAVFIAFDNDNNGYVDFGRVPFCIILDIHFGLGFDPNPNPNETQIQNVIIYILAQNSKKKNFLRSFKIF